MIGCQRCHKRISQARGLCASCYQHYARQIRTGKTTWQQLVNAGFAAAAEKQGATWANFRLKPATQPNASAH